MPRAAENRGGNPLTFNALRQPNLSAIIRPTES
jgi:hypothetical protein